MNQSSHLNRFKIPSEDKFQYILSKNGSYSQSHYDRSKVPEFFTSQSPVKEYQILNKINKNKNTYPVLHQQSPFNYGQTMPFSYRAEEESDLSKLQKNINQYQTSDFQLQQSLFPISQSSNKNLNSLRLQQQQQQQRKELFQQVYNKKVKNPINGNFENNFLINKNSNNFSNSIPVTLKNGNNSTTNNSSFVNSEENQNQQNYAFNLKGRLFNFNQNDDLMASSSEKTNSFKNKKYLDSLQQQIEENQHKKSIQLKQEEEFQMKENNRIKNEIYQMKKQQNFDERKITGTGIQEAANQIKMEKDKKSDLSDYLKRYKEEEEQFKVMIRQENGKIKISSPANVGRENSLINDKEKVGANKQQKQDFSNYGENYNNEDSQSLVFNTKENNQKGPLIQASENVILQKQQTNSSVEIESSREEIGFSSIQQIKRQRNQQKVKNSNEPFKMPKRESNLRSKSTHNDFFSNKPLNGMETITKETNRNSQQKQDGENDKIQNENKEVQQEVNQQDNSNLIYQKRFPEKKQENEKNPSNSQQSLKKSNIILDIGDNKIQNQFKYLTLSTPISKQRGRRQHFQQHSVSIREQLYQNRRVDPANLELVSLLENIEQIISENQKNKVEAQKNNTNNNNLKGGYYVARNRNRIYSTDFTQQQQIQNNNNINNIQDQWLNQNSNNDNNQVFTYSNFIKQSGKEPNSSQIIY